MKSWPIQGCVRKELGMRVSCIRSAAERDLKALALIYSGSGLTNLGAILISRAASTLLSKGLIAYAPTRACGYSLTSAGSSALSRAKS